MFLNGITGQAKAAIFNYAGDMARSLRKNHCADRRPDELAFNLMNTFKARRSHS